MIVYKIPDDDKLKKLHTNNLQNLLRQRDISHKGLKKPDLIKKLIELRDSQVRLLSTNIEKDFAFVF